MGIFSRETLILNVLNSLADSEGLKSSDLVFLNFNFNEDEITKLMKFISEKQVKRIPLSKKEFIIKVRKIKPDIEGEKNFCKELIEAFDAEERFPDILND